MPKAPATLEGLTIKDTPWSVLNKLWQQMARVVNGHINFGDGTNGDNIDGSWVTVTPPLANTDFTVNHFLNRIPAGYLVMSKSVAADVYTGGVAATKTQITLKSTVAGVVLKLFIFCLLLSFITTKSNAQSTLVSGTVTDGAGQPWNNGTYKFQFQVLFNYTGPYIWTGGAFTGASISGSLDGTGSFTNVSVPSNTAITPAQTKWQIQVCPIGGASTGGCFSTTVTITGASQSLTSVLTPPAFTVNANPINQPVAYSDSEVIGPVEGSSYFNFTSGVIRTFHNGVWTNAVAASPGGLPGQTQVNNGSVLGGTSCENFPSLITGPVNIDCDWHPVGPNPYIDVARYGQYSNASPPSTTASCTNLSTSITLAAAIDFKDATSFPSTNVGNGIVIYQCGASTDLGTPTAPTVTPSGQLGIAGSGIINGATTYNYKFVAQSEKLGLTAASTAGTTTTGAATLGLNTVNLTSVTWNSTLNGEQVYTCSGNCNIGDNTPVRIDGFATNRFNGNYTVISHTAGTFTVYSPSVPAPSVTTESVAATAKLFACNTLTMPANAANTVEVGSDVILRWIIYRNNVLIAYAQARDPYYEDCGMTVPGGNFESFVPTSPGVAVNNALITTIVSGAGTASIVVANAAGNTISGQTAQHDNSKNLLAALAAASFNTPVYLNGANTPFNAPTIFVGVNSTKLLLPVGVVIKEPWVIRGNGMTFEGGQSTSGNSFALENPSGVSGSTFAYPTVGIEMGHGGRSGSGLVFNNLLFNATQLGSEAFETDFDQNNLFGVQMRNVGFFNSQSASNVNTSAAHFRGLSESSIGKPGDRNACSTAQSAPGPICMRFSTVSVAMNTGASGNASMVRDTQINGIAAQGGGSSYQFDTVPWLNSGGVSPFGAISVEIRNGLRESGRGPFLRHASGFGPSFKISYIDDDAPNASTGNGFVDNAATISQPMTLNVDHLTGSVGGQAVIVGPASLSGDPGTVIHTMGPNATTGTQFSSGPGFNGTGNVQALGTGSVGYQFAAANTPTVVVGGAGSCSSNCVGAGTYSYVITAVDPYGNDSPRSAVSAGATTDGTQTITVSWVNVGGQFKTNIGRQVGTGSSFSGGAFLFSTGPNGGGVTGTSFTDASTNFYTFSGFNLGAGNSSSLGSVGVTTLALNAKRSSCDVATTLVAGDFALSAGWGTTASLAITATSSKDCAAIVTVTSSGTGQAANPTIAFTFHDGTWTNIPAAVLLQNGGNDIFGDVTTTATSATAFTWQWNGTPTAAKTYQFVIHVTGT